MSFRFGSKVFNSDEKFDPFDNFSVERSNDEDVAADLVHDEHGRGVELGHRVPVLVEGLGAGPGVVEVRTLVKICRNDPGDEVAALNVLSDGHGFDARQVEDGRLVVDVDDGDVDVRLAGQFSVSDAPVKGRNL